MKDIDNKVKNKWSWKWAGEVLSRDVPKVGPVTYTLGECLVKIDVAGVAFCKWCEDKVAYGGNGKKHLVAHCNTDKHVQRLRVRCTNYSLGGTFAGAQKDKTKDSETGGKSSLFSIFSMKKPSIAPTEKKVVASGSTVLPPDHDTAKPAEPLIPLADRTANLEALFLSVASEHSLPLSVIPVLVDLAKECSRDPAALAGVSISKTSASYKLKHGVAKTMTEEIVSKLKSVPFSLNVDESTSGHGKKVLAMMASFFDSDEGKVVVHHLASVELVVVTSKSVFGAIVKVIEDFSLPWSNLISVLLNVMRGCKSGVEVLLKEKAPHLIDIDGDSCHHIHNVAKTFCKPFEWWIERLFTDLHLDFKYCTEYKELMRELCRLGNVNFTVPQRFVSHRWLSAYDQALETARLLEVYTLFYSAFLPLHLRSTYTEVINNIIQKMESKMARRRARAIISKLRAKSMTDDGKARKERIVSRLFENQGKTLAILHLYITVLNLLKQFVLKFQRKEPLIHSLHMEQEKLVRNFLCCFIKAETLAGRSASGLSRLINRLEEQAIEAKDMYKGPVVDRILEGESLSSSQKEEFLSQVKTAFLTAGHTLLNKLPLTNETLRNLSALDGDLRQHHHMKKCMEGLIKTFHHIFTDKEIEDVNVELLGFTCDETLPELNGGRVDEWWEARTSYPCLQKLAKAALSSFHGPQVESAFNLMKDTLGSKAGSLDVSVLSSYQTVKYFIKAKESSAVKLFPRTSILHTPVNPAIVKNIRTSAGSYKSELKQKRAQLSVEFCALSLSRSHASLQTAAAARRVREKNVVLSFTKHQRMALKRKPADKSQKPSSSSNQKGAKKRRL